MGLGSVFKFVEKAVSGNKSPNSGLSSKRRAPKSATKPDSTKRGKGTSGIRMVGVGQRESRAQSYVAEARKARRGR